MQTLTKKQAKILEFIKGFIDEQGYAPSYREIGKYFNLSSVATIAEHVSSLKAKGYLNNADPGTARSLQLTSVIEENHFFVPLFGYIAAGEPIEAIKTDELISIPKDMMANDVFALKVRGDSMTGDGILDGDYVIIEPCLEPKNGEIVVALLDRENATLKRYYKEGDHVRLQPANSAYAPIRTRKVLIQGRVKGVIRRFA